MGNAMYFVNKRVDQTERTEIGTRLFMPISAHRRLTQYPRDDLESLIYVLLYLLKRTVPWNEEKWLKVPNVPTNLMDAALYMKVKMRPEVIFLLNFQLKPTILSSFISSLCFPVVHGK